MKKILCTLLCALMLSLTGCGKDIPALDTIGVDNFETVSAELTDCTRDDLLKAWGEPDGELSGLFGDVWELEGELETLLNVYYNGDGTYNSALISYQIAYTGTVTEIGEPVSAEATTYKVTVELESGETVVLDTMATTVYTGADGLAVGNKANFVCNAITGSQYLWIQSAESLE